MIKTIYKVVYDAYIGYADTIEEAKEMEKKFKIYSDDNKPIFSVNNTYDVHMNELRKKI